MKLRKKQGLIVVLAFLLAIEPMVIPIYRVWGQEAREIPTTSLDLKSEDIDVTRFVKPMKILRDGLIQRGGYTSNLAYNRAWANWAILMSQSYLLYGREAHEMVTLERAMSPEFLKDVLGVREIGMAAPKFLGLAEHCLGAIGARLPLIASEVGASISASNWALGLQRIFKTWKETTEGLISGNRILANLEAFSYPGSSRGFSGAAAKAAFTEVEGNTGLGANAGAIVGPFRVALGILTVYMVAHDASTFLAGYEFRTGFEAVLNGVGWTLELIGLMAFLLPIPWNLVVAVASVIMALIKGGISAVREWMSHEELAYRDSFRFLKDCDPEFRSFTDNSSSWPGEIKAESLKVLEEYVQSVGGAEQFTGDNLPVARGLEGAMNQAKVMTYYNREYNASLLDDTEILKQMWIDKMDYMSWRPSQRDRDYDDDASRESIWGRVGMGFNNFWYNVSRDARERLSPLGRLINRNNIQDSMPKVLYNPDFYLYRQIRRWREPAHPNLERWIKFRFETAPYHFIPLVEIGVDQWGTIEGGGPIHEAMLCDMYLSSLKSLKAIESMIRGVANQIHETAENLRDRVTETREELIEGVLLPQARALIELGEAYTADSGGEISEDLWEALEEHLEFDSLPEGTARTAEAVVGANKLLIQNHLNLMPYTAGNLQAEAMLSVDTAVSFFLMYQIFRRELGEKVKRESDEIYRQIQHEKFKKFLDHNEYLCFTTGILSRPGIPKEQMGNILESISDNGGEAMSAFRQAVNDLVVADDHPGMHYRGFGILKRYRGGLHDLQARLLKALQIWAPLTGRTGVRIQVPHVGIAHSSIHDARFMRFSAQDGPTKEIFVDGFDGHLFQMEGGPPVDNPGEEAAGLYANETAASEDWAPVPLFEPLKP